MAMPASGVILIVDDDVVVRSTAQAILNHSGYEVHTADGGRSGLAMIQRLGHKLDLVLLDWRLPDLGGSAGSLLTELSKSAPRAQVVVSTGYGREDLAVAQRPDTRFLEKPYSAATLISTVSECLADRPRGESEAPA